MICNRLVHFILAVMACWLVSVTPLHAAQTLEVYADVIGDSPEDAREKAIDYAKKRAFYLMLYKMDPEQANTIAEGATAEDIERNVRGYEIAQERLIDNRYQALFNVTVADDQMHRLLAGGAMDAIPLNAMLIIPVLDTGTETMLWQGQNVWRSIWNSVALEKGEGKLLLPFGDPTDMSIVDHTTVLSRGYDGLKELAMRYGAKEVAVVLATYETNREPIGVLVTIRRMGDGVDKLRDMFFEASNSGDTPEVLLLDAARVVADQLKVAAQQFETQQDREVATAQTVKVRAQFRRVSEWAAMQTMLKSLPRVVKVDIDSISIQSADATLHYNGTPEMLMRSMQANGLEPSPQQGYWLLQLRQ